MVLSRVRAQSSVLAFTVLAFLAGAGGGAAQAPSSEETAAPRADTPEALLRMARLEENGKEADGLYRALLEKFPDSPLADDALFAIAMESYSQGYQQAAEREFRRILEEYPEGDRAEDAGYWCAVVLLAAGDLDRAAERFQSLIDNRPSSEKSAWARAGLADCFRLRGDLLLAAQTYEETLTRFPSADFESATLFHLARLYDEMEHDARALELYKRLSEAYPQTCEGVQATLRAGQMSPGFDLTIPNSAGGADSRPQGTLTEESASGPAADVGTTETSWALQVGAFAIEENADRLVRVLAAHGYGTALVRADTRDGAALYRVWAGTYSTEADAHAAAKILRDQHHLQTAVLLYDPGPVPAP